MRDQTPTSQKGARRRLRYMVERSIQIAVSVCILAVLWRFMHWQQLVTDVQRTDVYLWLAALAVLQVGVFLRAARWKVVLHRPTESYDVRLSELYVLVLIGVAVGVILPLLFSDLARSYYGYRRSGLKEPMLASTLLDRVIGVFALCVLATVASLTSGQKWAFQFSTAMAAGTVLVALLPQWIPATLVNRSPSWLDRFLRLRVLVDVAAIGSIRMVVATILAIFGWLMTYFGFYLICVAFSTEVDLVYVLSVAALITFARLLPFTADGWGTQEAAVIYLLGRVGVNAEAALSISVMSRVLGTYVPALAGGAIMFIGQRHMVGRLDAE